MPQGGTNEEVLKVLARVDTLDLRVAQVAEGVGAIGTKVDRIAARVSELKQDARSILQMVLPDADVKEIRDLVREVKKKTGLTKLAIVGKVRQTIGTGGVYRTANPTLVKNVLRNMMGK